MSKHFNLVNCILIIISLGLAGCSAYLFYYFCTWQFQLCEPITNCTYEVIKGYDGMYYYYYYQYVVNNYYRCQFGCYDMYNISTCPKNGSKCSLTADVVTDCRLLGSFEPLFSCVTIWQEILYPLCALLITCVFILIGGLLIMSMFENNDNVDKQSKIGLYIVETGDRPTLFSL